MDVLVGGVELELSRVQLPLDPAKASLDRGQLRPGEDVCGAKAACVRDAPRDVVRIELVVDRDRG
jgi:hypothetical protein